MAQRWMIHSYQNPSKFVTHAVAKRMLKKLGGSYDWVEGVCHVYIVPRLELVVKQRSQEELSPFYRKK